MPRLNLKSETVKRKFQSPAWKTVWPDFLAFALGLAVAWLFNWKTSDLVWSLWLGSLTLGYLTILSFIGAGVYVGIYVISRPEFPARKRLPVVLAGTAGVLFLLGFFSLHFGAFHACHAGFLSVFFPLDGVKPVTFFDCFINPPRLLATAFRHVAPLYGAFLLPAIIAERAHVFATLGIAIRAVHENQAGRQWTEWLAPGPARQMKLRDPFTRPYLNVIRMHLLIFFFGACHVLHLESFLIYAAVYAVYFFPWNAFFPRPANAPA